MLLGEGGFVGHRQLDFAWSDPCDFDAERLHHALPGEARAHALGEIADPSAETSSLHSISI